jgi:hypothetical protein
MEQIGKIAFETKLAPEQLKSLKLKTLLNTLFKGKIYNGILINTVNKIMKYSFGNVISTGEVMFYIDALCSITDPIVNQTYDICITNNNKLGAFYNSDNIFVFIPKTCCINGIIPVIGDMVTIKIIGKRIENKISCIGSIIQASIIEPN